MRARPLRSGGERSEAPHCDRERGDDLAVSRAAATGTRGHPEALRLARIGQQSVAETAWPGCSAHWAAPWAGKSICRRAGIGARREGPNGRTRACTWQRHDAGATSSPATRRSPPQSPASKRPWAGRREDRRPKTLERRGLGCRDSHRLPVHSKREAGLAGRCGNPVEHDQASSTQASSARAMSVRAASERYAAVARTSSMGVSGVRDWVATSAPMPGVARWPTSAASSAGKRWATAEHEPTAMRAAPTRPGHPWQRCGPMTMDITR